MTASILLRVLMAAVVGMVIGLLTGGRWARVFTITCMGATLLTVTSVSFFQMGGYPKFGDPARLSAQIVSAIGFIGTGLIWISDDQEIQGLSVAASLWLTAILGLLIGAGLEHGTVAAIAFVIVLYLSSGFYFRRLQRKKNRNSSKL